MAAIAVGSASDIASVARERFGFARLRPGQAEAIQAVLDGRDTLAVFPTGAGKSAIYQISGSMISGATVVVSPLIALQRDQVESLAMFDAGKAAAVNAQRTATERQTIFDGLANGRIEFVFLSPEQLANEETLERLAEAGPSLFVVDEAHCISQWGHDFRPDYARLGEAIVRLGRPRVLALTATAAPPVRQEIVERLGLVDPLVIVQGFDRPNIALAVQRTRDEVEKRAWLHALIDAEVCPGIVYSATRQATEAIAAELNERGRRAAAYHAGLDAAKRDAVQSAFMEDKLEIVVATIAFGMGIDKPNVRFVVHESISDSLDSYYQEIGRGGRDGQRASATLLALPDDFNLRRFQTAGVNVKRGEAASVIRVIARTGSLEANDIATKAKVRKSAARAVVHCLRDLDVIPGSSSSTTALTTRDARGTLPDRIVARQEQHRRFARTRLEMMRQYADTGACRRAFLLSYFGELYHPPCRSCDNCLRGTAKPASSAEEPFPLNSSVHHPVWGEGVVLRYEHDTLTVLFNEEGYRTMATQLVMEEGLLTIIDQ